MRVSDEVSIYAQLLSAGRTDRKPNPGSVAEFEAGFCSGMIGLGLDGNAETLWVRAAGLRVGSSSLR